MPEGYVVRLKGLEKGRELFITHGNAFPPQTKVYATREEAQQVADKCPSLYEAEVVEVLTR